MTVQATLQALRKNSPLITLACYKYILSLFAVSAVALNGYRRYLFLYSSETECVNMVVIYMLYDLKLKLWLRSNPVSKSSLIRHSHYWKR